MTNLVPDVTLEFIPDSDYLFAVIYKIYELDGVSSVPVDVTGYETFVEFSDDKTNFRTFSGVSAMVSGGDGTFTVTVSGSATSEMFLNNIRFWRLRITHTDVQAVVVKGAVRFG